MRVLIGCEESQAVCKAFRELGHEAYSCDTEPCSGGKPEWHLRMDVFEAIKLGNWDLGIFFPTCTYLTCSAEWAYKEGPYHQKIKPGTLVGKERIKARAEAFEFFMALWNCDIKRIAIENPVGIMSRFFRKPDQIIQPWQFGDDASKKTCLWLKNLPKLKHYEKNYFPPRLVDDNAKNDVVYRWGNQTDSGQNKLPPTEDRHTLRSKTYHGIAKSMSEQWSKYIFQENCNHKFVTGDGETHCIYCKKLWYE